jgi:hypothetical protein
MAHSAAPVRAPNLLEPGEVRELFASVLRRNAAPPDAIACARAARVITFAALNHKAPEAVSASQRRDAQALRWEITKLTAMLDVQAARWKPMLPAPWLPETAVRDIIRLRADRIRRIETARVALEELQPIWDEQIWPSKTWHDAAFELLFAFEQAMRTVYPDRRFGHSRGGPAVRFIHALLPRVAGVTETEHAIATILKRGRCS